ncbi:hypothetical protein A3K82_01670 [Candidatus Pacearchaeota archaeon RBG_19FT_COMBO_34_9]|nr:MAG: hypothetical protein A3K82_01670 [Candidatus Pacearchaeota archaeon RBG_19FT_COMBO_34_9]OGJ16754.1 MAG: hypothetical protein A3K74_00880 [Candidatus Pacearchaeota archaeon RBG_13_33_26]
MFELNKEELGILKQLNTPRKIQDFLNRIPINFEENGDTCMSPRKVLKENKAHCIEGALLAAVAMKMMGKKPLIVDLEANQKDFDHVICVFQKGKKWGSISKTNHAVLRYREPVYNSIRELVMSFFHEYFDDNGSKNLRRYSDPVDLSIFDNLNWITSEKDVWEIPEYLTCVKHYPILTKRQIHSLRKADILEIEAGKLTEWKPKDNNP